MSLMKIENSILNMNIDDPLNDVSIGEELKRPISETFYCFFCSKFETIQILELINHINKEHLNYYPFICKICHSKYPSIYALFLHGRNHKTKRNLEFEFKPTERFDDWLSKLVKYFGNDKHLHINQCNDCPICKKYNNYFNSIEYYTTAFSYDDCQIDKKNDFKTKQTIVHPKTTKFINLDKEQVIQIYHVHYHLQYYPYNCVGHKFNPDGSEKNDINDNEICDFRFPFVGKEFYDHLKIKHGIDFALTDNIICYEKTYLIEQLDQLVEQLYYEKAKSSKEAHVSDSKYDSKYDIKNNWQHNSRNRSRDHSTDRYGNRSRNRSRDRSRDRYRNRSRDRYRDRSRNSYKDHYWHDKRW